MGKDTQISPVVGGIIIAVLVVIVGYFIYAKTGPKPKIKYSPEAIAKMREMTGARTGGGGGVSGGAGQPAGNPGGPR